MAFGQAGYDGIGKPTVKRRGKIFIPPPVKHRSSCLSFMIDGMNCRAGTPRSFMKLDPSRGKDKNSVIPGTPPSSVIRPIGEPAIEQMPAYQLFDFPIACLRQRNHFDVQLTEEDNAFQMAGFDKLKNWLHRAAIAFSEQA